MLDPFVQRHPQVEPVGRRPVHSEAAPLGQLVGRLPVEVQKIVTRHPAHEDDDEDNVGAGDEVQEPVGAVRGNHVDRSTGEVHVRTGMTLAARPGQVGLVHPRIRIA